MAFGLSFFISAFCLEALVVVQLLSLIWLLVTPWTAACQGSLSFTISQSLLKPMSIDLTIPSNHLILCSLLLILPSIFPSIRVFSNGSALHIRWPDIGVSASVLLISIQDWFPLGLTGLISLQSKGLSRVFQHHRWKASILQRSAFFMVQLSHPYMTTGGSVPPGKP